MRTPKFNYSTKDHFYQTLLKKSGGNLSPASISDLVDLKHEITKLKTEAEQRISIMSSNITLVKNWMKKEPSKEKLVQEKANDVLYTKPAAKNTPRKASNSVVENIVTSHDDSSKQVDSVIASRTYASKGQKDISSILQSLPIYTSHSQSKKPQTPMKSSQFSKPQTKATPKPSKSTPGLQSKENKKRTLSKMDDDLDIIEAPVVDGDYSRSRPTTQVPLTQFYAYMDQFFRNITDEDIKFLEHSGDDVGPFITPALGKHYLHQWAQEDGFNMDADNTVMSQKINGADEEYQQIDDIVYPGDVEFGGFWPRLLSALIQDPNASGMRSTNESEIEASPNDFVAKKLDMAGLEERLKSELKYIGILRESDVEVHDSNIENDEISIALRRAQAQLRNQIIENTNRKEILKRCAQDWMGWQEYNSLLDELNKLVEAAYDKKFRNPKIKKKKVSNTPYIAQVFPNDNISALLDKREKLIQSFSPFFNSERFTVPRKSIYEKTGD